MQEESVDARIEELNETLECPVCLETAGENDQHIYQENINTLYRRETLPSLQNYFVEPPYFSGSFSPIIGDNKKLSEVRYAVKMDGRTK